MKPKVKQVLEGPLARAQLLIFGTAFYFEVIAAVCIIIGLIITFLGVPRQILLLRRSLLRDRALKYRVDGL